MILKNDREQHLRCDGDLTGESEQAEGDKHKHTGTAALWCDEVEHDAKFSDS